MPFALVKEVPSPHFAPPQQRRARGLPEWLALAAYVAVVAFAIPSHEPWEDEAQAWQIAKSVSVRELFQHTLRYEGTPGLWHLLLHALSRMHISYAGMHWITAGIATLGIALLLFFSPFPRIFRLTLPFTFLLAFQYAVVARSYALVPLLLFATAALWKRTSPVLPALFLGLLANVASHSFALSIGFALVYAIELRRGLRARPSRPECIRAVVLLVLLWSLAVYSVLPPPPDLSFGIPEWNEPLGQRILLWPLVGILPLLPVIARPGFLSLVLCIVFARKMAQQHALFYFLPVICLAALCGHYCSFWHAGLVVPAVITACWLIAQDHPLHFDRWTCAIAALVIAMHIAWTAAAVIYDHRHAYSPDLAAAQFLAPHVRAAETMAVTYERDPYANAFSVVGLYSYLPDLRFLNEPRSYWLWSRNEHTEAGFLQAMQQHPHLVLIEYRGMNPSPDISRDFAGDHIALLRNQGYRAVATFCGRMTEGSRLAPETRCHIIFQR